MEYDSNSTQIICTPLHVVPLIITSGLISCGIIIGNSLVIIAIVGGNVKFHRPMYWFIVHLSCSDLLVGAMMLWNYCLAAIFNISNTLTSLSILQAAWVTSSCSSILGILLLAIDRYMQVVHKRVYSRYFNEWSVGIAIFFAWLIPVLVFLVSPIAFKWSCDQCSCRNHNYMDCLPFNECSQVIPPFTKSFVLIGLIYLYFMMPWPILVYSLIFFKARKSAKVLHQRMRHREFRLIRTLVAIMLAFIVTLSPVTVVMTIDYFTTDHNSQLVDRALYAFVISTINSLLNPVLYIWRIPSIRMSLKQRFGCCGGVKLTQADPKSKNKLLGHFNSENVDDIAPSLPSPLDPAQLRTFIFCGKRFSSNCSDTSQTSTPTLLSSLKKRRKKNTLEMTRLSADLHHSAPSLSPPCGTDDTTVKEAKSLASSLEVPSENEANGHEEIKQVILIHAKCSDDDGYDDGDTLFPLPNVS